MNSLWFLVWVLLLLNLTSISVVNVALAQTDVVLKTIAVEEVISDKKIQQRLNEILVAISSYEHVNVKVVSGVVILSGFVDQQQQIKWVNDLAARIDGVVAVQNQIKSLPKEILDLTPAREEIDGFNVTFIRHLPSIVLAVGVFAISLLLFFLTSFGFRRAFSKKISSPLLLNATAKVLSVPVFLLGLYLALRISGLAGLAVTVLGGTGLLGLALGMGLKNSFEDYVASILLSIRKPFRPNDWVRIGEYEGIVQKVTSRSTLIIDFEGNHVLLPNGLVYKSIVTNKTANPKMRCDFVFGLDYGDSIESAQIAVLELLAKTPLVLKDPDPWVLVEKLGDSAVNLRVYFWLNVREVSTFKVTSHIILKVKNLLLAKGFHFPDPNREILFTNKLLLGRQAAPPKVHDVEAVMSDAPPLEEVQAEVSELNKQARESDLPDQGESVI